jgi:hypothetical protein
MKDSCSSLSPLLERYFDREVTDQERALVETHLADCSACKNALRSMEGLGSLMKVPLEAYAREEDFTRVWLKIQRRTRSEEKPSWREAFRAWFVFPVLLQKRVWIPAVATLLVLIFITVPLLFKESPSIPGKFGVEYVESMTNNVMVYEIEKERVTVIWLLEGTEGEPTTS